MAGDGRGWPGMAGDGQGWLGMAGDGEGLSAARTSPTFSGGEEL